MDHALSLDRRALLGSMAAALGIAMLPAEALAAGKRAARRTLGKPQFALLTAVVDTILPTTDTPGALAANVPARLDGLLGTWASPETRASVVGALDRIEAAARGAKGKGFAKLSPAERTELLKAHDAAALKPVPAPPGAPKSAFSMAAYVADQGYLKVKELTISLYYYSEVGTANELVYEHVPGKFEPSIKLTPQSRPYLGPGPF